LRASQAKKNKKESNNKRGGRPENQWDLACAQGSNRFISTTVRGLVLNRLSFFLCKKAENKFGKPSGAVNQKDPKTQNGTKKNDWKRTRRMGPGQSTVLQGFGLGAVAHR